MSRKQIRSMSESDLRLAAGGILKPGPWKHKWEMQGDVRDFPNERDPIMTYLCLKCGKQTEYNGWDMRQCIDHPISDCPVPDPAEDPLAVVAEQLVHHALETVGFWKLWESVRCVLAPHMSNRSSAAITEKWLRAPAAEKIHCCLLALNHMEVTP